ncbi:hypothetical protein B0909_00810 [Rhizobium rhizogenes]|nr:hypothetical protein B0909_00810 [Rhizobium rhizogenes]
MVFLSRRGVCLRGIVRRRGEGGDERGWNYFWGALVGVVLPPSALPGISPSRGEIDLRRGFAHLNV